MYVTFCKLNKQNRNYTTFLTAATDKTHLKSLCIYLI